MPKINQNKYAFKYQDLKTLEFLLFKQLITGNKEGFVKIIKEYVSTIKQNIIYTGYLTTKFYEVFSTKTIKNDKEELLNIGCIDLNFNNIFYNEKNKNYLLIDYEWTFDFSIPYRYIIFRAITDFYSRYRHYKPNKVVKIDTLLKMAKITPKEERRYIGYEYNFQKYVNNNEFSLNTNKTSFYTNYQNIRHNTEPEKYFTELSKYQSKNQKLKSNLNTLTLEKHRLQSKLNKIQEYETKFEEIKKLELQYTQQNKYLNNQAINLKNEINIQNDQLNKIFSSKFYITWRMYNKIKELLKI